MVWVNAIVQGILLGGLYALFATGLSLAFGVMRFVNLAHGDIAILAAFMAFSLTNTLDINPLVTLLIVLPGAFVVGFVLQRLVFDRVVGVDPAFQIVATFGVGVIIQNALLEKYTADTRGLNVGELETATIRINDYDRHRVDAADHVALRGRRARRPGAVHQAHQARPSVPGDIRRPRRGTLMGIDVRRVFAVAMALAIATVALAGVLLGAAARSPRSAGREPDLRVRSRGDRWPRLVVGHPGRRGHVGRRTVIGNQIDPQWGQLAGHLVFLAVLATRPTGMFGKVAMR